MTAPVSNKEGTFKSRRGGLHGILRALYPKKVGLKARLASFPTANLPIEGRVNIRWNDFQVPHIEAQTDHDLFVTLGMVHAHLRGGQIGLFRMFYNGRLSEMFGPFTKNLDHALRVIDYAQAAEDIERNMPDETRAWNEAFLKGMNVYQERQKDLPPEYGLLGITHQPCTMRELIVGARFAGTDFTWLTFMSLLPRRGQPGFAKLWNRTLEAGENPTPGAHAEGTPGTLEDLLVGAGRGGSNAFAVAPHRSASGGTARQRPSSRIVATQFMDPCRITVAVFSFGGFHDPWPAHHRIGPEPRDGMGRNQYAGCVQRSF